MKITFIRKKKTHLTHKNLNPKNLTHKNLTPKKKTFFCIIFRGSDKENFLLLEHDLSQRANFIFLTDVFWLERIMALLLRRVSDEMK